MKIVQIAATRHGGAGRAAWRQHIALLKNGVESWFLSNDPMQGSPDCNWVTVQPATNSIWRRVTKNAASGSKFYFDNKSVHQWSRRILQATDTIDAEMCSLPFSHWLLHEHPLVKKASIVNLHWVAGILDYPSFFDGFDKPIVWSLHDMQPFSGVFHYEDDFSKNLSLSDVDEELREVKANCIKRRASMLTLVAPSTWMLEKAKQSLVFSGLDGCVVPYSVDLSTFKPKDKAACRERLGLPVETKLLFFISHHIETPRKGFSILQAALSKMADHFNEWALVSVGDRSKKETDLFPTFHRGSISSDEELADYYGAADIVVIPSLEDNLPNVLLEAFACGRPVISFTNGGMAEHVMQGVNGWLGSPVELTSLLLNARVSHDLCDVNIIRGYAENVFSSKKQADDFQRIYEMLLHQ